MFLSTVLKWVTFVEVMRMQLMQETANLNYVKIIRLSFRIKLRTTAKPKPHFKIVKLEDVCHILEVQAYISEQGFGWFR